MLTEAWDFAMTEAMSRWDNPASAIAMTALRRGSWISLMASRRSMSLASLSLIRVWTASQYVPFGAYSVLMRGSRRE